MGQRWAVCLFLVLACGSVGVPAVATPRASAFQASQEDENGPPFLRLRAWATAVREHEPGKFDPPASSVNDWMPGDLQAVATDLKAMVRSLVAARESLQKAAKSSAAIPFDLVVTLWEDQEVLGLTDDEVVRGDANRILKRGALLHADIAMLAVAAGGSENGRSVNVGRPRISPIVTGA